ncbi:MAG: hypothetical protein H0W88_08315 [Parachlamydiaceae bacterium]|nr:hypothetical protein [Parachlamydiaceae bacterium]
MVVDVTKSLETTVHTLDSTFSSFNLRAHLPDPNRFVALFTSTIWNQKVFDQVGAYGFQLKDLISQYSFVRLLPQTTVHEDMELMTLQSRVVEFVDNVKEAVGIDSQVTTKNTKAERMLDDLLKERSQAYSKDEENGKRFQLFNKFGHIFGISNIFSENLWGSYFRLVDPEGRNIIQFNGLNTDKAEDQLDQAYNFCIKLSGYFGDNEFRNLTNLINSCVIDDLKEIISLELGNAALFFEPLRWVLYKDRNEKIHIEASLYYRTHFKDSNKVKLAAYSKKHIVLSKESLNVRWWEKKDSKENLIIHVWDYHSIALDRVDYDFVRTEEGAPLVGISSASSGKEFKEEQKEQNSDKSS